MANDMAMGPNSLGLNKWAGPKVDGLALIS